MELYQFKYFEAVARNQSFTKASTELHISQPSLSQAIKLTEKECNCQLLERNTRKVYLSEAGIIFLKHSRNMLKQLKIVNEEMSEVQNIGAGIINIGIIESSKYWIPKILTIFQKHYPTVKVSITELIDINRIKEALINYDIHLSIAPSQPKNPVNKYSHIYKERFEVVVPAGHRLIRQKDIKLTDLKQEKFILCKEGFQTRQIIVEACKNAGFEPNISHQLERLETACSLVEAGLGITILPKNYLGYANTDLERIQIRSPAPSRSVYLAYNPNRYLAPSVKAFMGYIFNFFHQD